MSPTCCTERSCEAGLPPEEAEPCGIILCKTSLLPFLSAHAVFPSRQRDEWTQLPRKETARKGTPEIIRTRSGRCRPSYW